MGVSYSSMRMTVWLPWYSASSVESHAMDCMSSSSSARLAASRTKRSRSKSMRSLDCRT